MNFYQGIGFQKQARASQSESERLRLQCLQLESEIELLIDIATKEQLDKYIKAHGLTSAATRLQKKVAELIAKKKAN